MAEAQKNIYLTVDADAVRAADVPGVSAPTRSVYRAEMWPHACAWPDRFLRCQGPRPGRDQSASGSRRRSARGSRGRLNFLIGLAVRTGGPNS